MKVRSLLPITSIGWDANSENQSKSKSQSDERQRKNLPLVSIVIVNYNGGSILRSCIDSIVESSYRPLEVIVIDNASDDDNDLDAIEQDRIIKNDSEIALRLIKNKVNIGFPQACNHGIQQSNGKYLLLLNYDVTLHSEAIAELVNEATRNERAGFYQPKILMFDNPRVINSTGISVHVAGFGLLRGVGEIDLGQYDLKKEVSAVHGACIFASKSAMEDVGLLDRFFFAFNEDTDLGIRALMRGWRPTFVSNAIVYHRWGHSWGSASRLSNKLYYVERNRTIMVLNNYETRTLILLIPIMIFAEVVTFAYCLGCKIPKAKIRAYADVFRARHYIFHRRRWIQSRRLVGDRSFFKNFTGEFRHPVFAGPMAPIGPANACFKTLWSTLRHSMTNDA
jgi:GT2 family glycosyltransferase